MLLFLLGQFERLLSQSLQTFVDGGVIWFAILGLFALEIVLRYILKSRYNQSGP